MENYEDNNKNTKNESYYDTKANILWNVEKRRDLLPVLSKSIYGEQTFNRIFGIMESIMEGELDPKDAYNPRLLNQLKWFCIEYSLHLKIHGFKEHDKDFIVNLSTFIGNFRKMTNCRELDGVEEDLEYNLMVPEFKRLLLASSYLSKKMEALTTRTTPMQEIAISANEAIMDRCQNPREKSVDYKNIIKEEDENKEECSKDK